MSEYAGLDARLTELSNTVKTAMARLEAATTPTQEKEAQSDVKDARSDLTAELRSRGLTLKDLDALQEQKFSARVDERVQAALAERDRIAAEAAAATDEDEEGGDSFGKRVRDGLGGVRNVKPT